jgi:hypothetical protein
VKVYLSTRLILAAFLFASFTACASTSGLSEAGAPKADFDSLKDPYWQNPRWDLSLIDAVQAAIHNPVDAADTSTPDYNATVKFTYLQGVIQYPEIVTGTGDAKLDELMLHQLASVQAPQATGIDADKPHEFILDVVMSTPFRALQDSIYAAINNWKLYPVDAVISGSMGNTTVDFDYSDGKAMDITVTQASKNKLLDRTSVNTVTKAKLPQAPIPYAGKILHMEVIFCYSLGQSAKSKDPCPVGANVIEVTGTRIRRG